MFYDDVWREIIRALFKWIILICILWCLKKLFYRHWHTWIPYVISIAVQGLMPTINDATHAQYVVPIFFPEGLASHMPIFLLLLAKSCHTVMHILGILSKSYYDKIAIRYFGRTGLIWNYHFDAATKKPMPILASYIIYVAAPPPPSNKC